MKKLEKIELTQKIARALQERMTFREIDAYLQEFEIDVSDTPFGDSKYEYVTNMLVGKPTALINEMASELGIGSTDSTKNTQVTFRFWKIGYFRIFVSHTTANKDKATRLARALIERGCVCFVAHEDIKPSLEWRKEILSALESTDALIAVLTKDFHASQWTDQEIGIALGHGKLVVPVMAGAKAYGFIEQFQEKKSVGLSTGQVADAIVEAVSSSEITGRKYADIVLALMMGSKNGDELKKWATLAQQLDSFDLAALRSLREQMAADPNIFAHVSTGFDIANDLLEAKGLQKVVRPRGRFPEFDDEIPF